MGIRAIFFRDGQFCNESSCGVSPKALGKDIVVSLLSGTEVTEFGVTVNYAVEMLRIVGKTGEFYDRTDLLSGDHDFDPNMPTLGDNWATVRSLRRLARLAAYAGKDLRDSELLHPFAPLLSVTGEFLHDTADMHDETAPVTRPFATSMQLPTVKCANRALGAEAIWFNPKANAFNFGGSQLGVDKLGRLIAIALMRGEEKVQVGDFAVTVNYLVQMCRLAGRHGEFVNYNDDLFDGNVPPRNGFREFTDFELEQRRLENDHLVCWASLR